MSLLCRLSLAAAALASVAAECAPPGRSDTEVLFFTAPWCGPCQRMTDAVETLSREGRQLRAVNVDEERTLAKKYDISSIPAFVAVTDGHVTGRRTGLQSTDSLRAWCSVIGSSADPSPRPTTPEAAAMPEVLAVPAATEVKTLVTATYPLPQAQAEALVAFLKGHSEIEFEADVDETSVRITAAPQVQLALGSFLRDVPAVGAMPPEDADEPR